MSIDIHKLLNIPRYRINGLSISNFIGTFILTLVCNKILNTFNYDLFTHFELYCLFIPLATYIHYIRNEYTPLVVLVINNKEYFCVMILMLSIAMLKYILLKILFISYIIIKCIRSMIK